MRVIAACLVAAACGGGRPAPAAPAASGWSCYAIDDDVGTGTTGCARSEAACTASLAAARAWPSDTVREFHDCAPAAVASCYPTATAPRCFTGAAECAQTHDGLASGATGPCADTR